MKQLTPTNLIAIEIPEHYNSDRVFIIFSESLDSYILEIQNEKTDNFINLKTKEDGLYYLGEVTKEGIQFDVEPYMEEPSGYIEEGYFGYKDYTLKGWVYCLNNPKESFQSLLKANNIEIPEGNKLLILLKQ